MTMTPFFSPFFPDKLEATFYTYENPMAFNLTGWTQLSPETQAKYERESIQKAIKNRRDRIIDALRQGNADKAFGLLSLECEDERGPNVPVNAFRQTALHACVVPGIVARSDDERKNLRCPFLLEYVIAAGVDPLFKDGHGKTAWDYMTDDEEKKMVLWMYHRVARSLVTEELLTYLESTGFDARRTIRSFEFLQMNFKKIAFGSAVDCSEEE